MPSPHFGSSLLAIICIILANSSAVDAQQIRGAAVDMKGQRHVSTPGRDYPWQADCLASLYTEYTYEDRAHHYQGVGLFGMIIDTQTGSVTQVKVLRSTGVSALDYRAIGALKKWRWKPGTWKEVDMPIVFTMAPRR